MCVCVLSLAGLLGGNQRGWGGVGWGAVAIPSWPLPHSQKSLVTHYFLLTCPHSYPPWVRCLLLKVHSMGCEFLSASNTSVGVCWAYVVGAYDLGVSDLLLVL